MQIDENDELASWEIICRQPYKDRMGEGVKDIVQKYWLESDTTKSITKCI